MSRRSGEVKEEGRDGEVRKDVKPDQVNQRRARRSRYVKGGY